MVYVQLIAKKKKEKYLVLFRSENPDAFIKELKKQEYGYKISKIKYVTGKGVFDSMLNNLDFPKTERQEMKRPLNFIFNRFAIGVSVKL